MINLNICAKCPKCKTFSPTTYHCGTLTTLPSVECELIPSVGLVGNSELPEGCPYILEQQLLEEAAYDEFESLMEECGQEIDDEYTT